MPINDALQRLPALELTSGSAIRDCDVGALGGSGVDLARAPNLGAWALHHLFPMGDPAWESTHCEEHWEHRCWEAHRSINEARVEIDIWVELLIDEVRVGKCDLLEPHCKVEQGIVAP